MKLKIETAETPDREQLRSLLLDAADQIAGTGASILEPRLRWDGQPMLLADAQLRPVLVSFEPQDSEAALINGLRGVEQLRNALPWINQVYETLQQRQQAPRLVVVAREFPPGATVLGACPGLRLYRYQPLSVNGEVALCFEPLDLPPAARATQESAPPRPDTTALPQQASNDILPPLSEAESAYFQQL
jgi:hypothetical protein